MTASREFVKEYIKAEISIKKRLLEYDELDDMSDMEMSGEEEFDMDMVKSIVSCHLICVHRSGFILD